jgi:hypothetical protein
MGKLGKIIYYSVVVLLVLIFVIILIGDSFAGSGFGLYFAIALSAMAILGTLVSSVIHLVNNPKGAKSLIIGAVALIAVCIIGYSVSPGEITEHFINYDVTTAHESKMIDMGIYLTAFLSVVSIGAILVSESIGLFKN